MEIHDIVQEALIKTTSNKKKCKGQMVFSGDLQIAEKRKEVKGKGEKERYIHLNAESQTIARRYKKDFQSDQCKDIEENNRMGNSRDVFKKIRAMKGPFHVKMGTIKDRNSKGVTKAKEMKRRWQEYIGELYKKVLMNQITTMVWSLT